MSYPDILLEDGRDTGLCSRASKKWQGSRAAGHELDHSLGPIGKFALGPLEGEPDRAVRLKNSPPPLR